MIKNWKIYAKKLSNAFFLSEKQVKEFLEEQESLWTKEFVQNFLFQEYGEFLPSESPLVVLPANTPHILLCELALASFAGWKPIFYVSGQNKVVSEVLHGLNFEVISKLPMSHIHVRSYGRSKLQIEAAYHVFHGPWYVACNFQDKNFLKDFTTLEGRGCLNPCILYGSKDLFQLLPQFPSNFDSELFVYYLTAFKAFGVTENYSLKDNRLVVEFKSMRDCYDFVRDFVPPVMGVYYFVQNFEEDFHLFPRLLNYNNLKKPLSTIPEPVIKSE